MMEIDLVRELDALLAVMKDYWKASSMVCD